MIDKPFKEPVALLETPFVPNVALMRELLASSPAASEIEPLRAALTRWIDALDRESAAIDALADAWNAGGDTWGFATERRRCAGEVAACEAAARALVR